VKIQDAQEKTEEETGESTQGKIFQLPPLCDCMDQIIKKEDGEKEIHRETKRPEKINRISREDIVNEPSDVPGKEIHVFHIMPQGKKGSEGDKKKEPDPHPEYGSMETRLPLPQERNQPTQKNQNQNLIHKEKGVFPAGIIPEKGKKESQEVKRVQRSPYHQNGEQEQAINSDKIGEMKKNKQKKKKEQDHTCDRKANKKGPARRR
jgi:hypothetical protein